jgi:hypothetical protein
MGDLLDAPGTFVVLGDLALDGAPRDGGLRVGDGGAHHGVARRGELGPGISGRGLGGGGAAVRALGPPQRPAQQRDQQPKQGQQRTDHECALVQRTRPLQLIAEP